MNPGSDRVVVTGPAAVRGTVRVPGDKSISHRALMLAGLAPGRSRITGLSGGEDVRHTAAAMAALGARVDDSAGFTTEVVVDGGTLSGADRPIDVGNSGTGIRLLAGLCAGLPFTTTLDGDESIRRRPMGRIVEPLRQMGADISGRDEGRLAPLVIRPAALHAITYELPVASAQVKSAVLFAGLFAPGETTVVEPTPTRAHTEEMFEVFGVPVHAHGGRISVSAAIPVACDVAVAADPSQAAFWVVAGLIAPDSEVTVPNVYLGPARGEFVDVLVRMGADLVVDRSAGTLTARSSDLHGTDVGPDEVPGLIDEIPILAVAAARAHGVTRFRGVGELRHKESDRLATTSELVAVMGAGVSVTDDELHVVGVTVSEPVTIDSHGDHRIAMAAAVAALVADGDSVIDGFDAVATSYPDFRAHLASLTGHGGDAS
ncbi:MAG: 3-phosphoshikimate 1-carboxyvinyltransferase [Acidimicrobiales bacterium]